MGKHQITSKAIHCKLSAIESTSHHESMQPGTRVRLIHDPDCIGVLTSHSKMRGEIRRWEVVFPSGSRYIPEDQFECINNTESPVDLLRAGRLSGAADLRRTLTHVRLSGHLIDLIYSMETTNTDFYPYQFKPVLKMLNSPSNGLLVADEVGLGKTIEAGLIWTELRSRFDFRRLMVLCPSMLREKWRRELDYRFGIDARIVDARETLDFFRRARQDGPFGEFALIGGMQGLRGSRRGGAANALQEFLNEQAYDEPLIDMLIIDEAHYLKNRESRTSRLGRALRRLAEHVVLLSATPIHLGSNDLFQLLNLIDAETFGYADIFDEVLEANAPLVKARDYVLQTKSFDRDELLELLQKAARHDLLKNSRQLGALYREIAEAEDYNHSFRSKVSYQLEEINLLGHTVTRTRKRDVHEHMVIREPKSLSISLSQPEKALYERVTNIVRGFCENSEAHEGFLLVMPQRQLASSMPAALNFWRAREDSDLSEQIYEDFGEEYEELDKPGTVLTEILGQLDDLKDLDTLKEHDQKYHQLLTMLRGYFSNNPGAKIVLFSYFRATLVYLSKRLREDGISTALLMGGMKDKDQVLEDFENPAGPRLLLSSEVASEGIDLQFSRVLINYDLPWNPMKVEQRIGRIDRLGQKADKIEIWNFFYENTIDQRIYDRLYERLNIFEYSLGGIEPILGEQIRELTLDLLGRSLSSEEEEDRILQTAQALENMRAEEERLEDEAAGLMAHGDYILQKVRDSHDTNRWVNAGDIQNYVIDFFQDRYQGCQFRQIYGADAEFDVQLTNRAKHDLDNYIRDERLKVSTLLIHNDPKPVRCRFEKTVGRPRKNRIELINHLHPVVRFIGKAIDTSEEKRRPAIAVMIPRSQTGIDITSGQYAFTIQKWSVQGLVDQEKLDIRVMPLTTAGGMLPDIVAEQLVMRAAAVGENWIEVHNEVDLERAAELAEEVGLATSEEIYRQFVQDIQYRNEDRADLQERSLDRHLESQLAVLKETLAGHIRNKTGLDKATEGKINKLKNRVERRRMKIRDRRIANHQNEDICVGLIKVI